MGKVGESERESARGYRYLQPSFAQCQEKLIRDCTAGVTAAPQTPSPWEERSGEGERGRGASEETDPLPCAPLVSSPSCHNTFLRSAFPIHSLNQHSES